MKSLWYRAIRRYAGRGRATRGLAIVLALVVSIGGTSSVALVPATGLSAAIASAPLAPGVVTYADDTFNRTIANGWGSADEGGPWATSGGELTDYKVNGSIGTISTTAGGSSRLAALWGVWARDVDITLRVQIDQHSPGGQYAYVLARRIEGGTEYRAQIHFDSGNIGLHAKEFDPSYQFYIGNEVIVPGLSYGRDSPVRVRVQVYGVYPTTIRMKAWADGAAEPDVWHYVGQNSYPALQEGGTIGLRVYACSCSSVSTLRFGFDDLKVTSVGQPPNVQWKPYLQQLSDTSVILLWSTWSGAQPVVRYSTDASYSATASGSTRTLNPLGTWLHRVALTGLRPNTVYYYKIYNDGVDQLPGEVLSFQTAPTVGSTDSFTFISFGDLGRNAIYQRQLRDQMLRDSFRFILTTGDNGEIDGSYREYDAVFFQIYQNLFPRVGLFPAMGNHDQDTAGGAPYRDLFELPANALRQSDRELYYSFDYGNAHFVVLNSNAPLDAVDGNSSNDMFDWLRKDLSETTQVWKIVSFHYPAYSTGVGLSDPRVQSKLVPIFEAYGVDLVLNANDDMYQRSRPLRGGQVTTVEQGGIVYVVTGAGDSISSPCFSAPWVAVSYCAPVRGGMYSKITVSGDRLTLQAINQQKSVKDSVAWSKTTPSSVPTATPTWTPTATRTPTNNPTPTATSIATSTPPTGGLFVTAADAFGRTVLNGWGGADVGGAYALSGGVGADFNVGGGAGTMAATKGGWRMAVLPSVSAEDVDLAVRVRTNTTAVGNSQYVNLLARREQGVAEYRVHQYKGQVRFTPTGTIGLVAIQSDASLDMPIGKEVLVPGLTYAPNTYIRVRMQVVGVNPTTIRMKAWADGQAEPSDWQYSVTNLDAALQRAGSVGVRVNLPWSSTVSPALFGFDDLRVSIVASTP